MKTYKVVIIAFSIISLFLSCFIIGCSEDGSTDNGDGNGTPTISGELAGALTYTTTWVNDPLTNTLMQRTIFSGYTPLIEDEDGNLFRLAAEGMNTHYEYDGMSLSEVIINIVGYTYTDALSSHETRDVGGQTRKVSYTGIQATVTGTIDTATTGSFPGDWIEVETIKELP